MPIGAPKGPRTVLAALDQTYIVPLTLGKDTATTGTFKASGIASFPGYVSRVRLLQQTTLAADDTNYLTYSIVNVTNSNAVVTLASGADDANTTKLTGGATTTLNVARDLTLATDLTKRLVSAGDVLNLVAAIQGTLGAAQEGLKAVVEIQRTG